ncbi:acyl-CoA N-acyltransferase [Stachybotrys elegans]|uniref:Glycylpeptide N-tetradecanoyltransferase n=1 Tax=Stachybotrys elegans TaxID=80388 RepID=A0A8K0ST62_9HYPO|nr:acyl-CoA N-acyltransferase [Stachybotrys elegans]
MPAEESKPVDPAVAEADAKLKGKDVEIESGSEDEEEHAADDATAEAGSAPAATAAKKKKKRSKRKRIKDALTGGSSSSKEAELQQALANLEPEQLKELMKLNPGLAREMEGVAGTSNPSADQAADALKKMNLQEIMTGLAAGGKNAKDMGSYKFWQTQPVPKFGEESIDEEGPLKIQTIEEVPKEPSPLVAGFEWVTMDLTSDEEIKEVYELLNGHYVEDDEAMFRFNYSPAILRWAMMAPGWKARYHVGVRATQSRKLVAFISAIPVNLRVRGNMILCSEVNFLCVHKKLRGKRLTPVLIKEITRRSNEDGIWQGLFTAGIVLPKPISTCRYFHRAINWMKLYECGFSPLPPGSKPAYQVRRFALPDNTSTKGLRKIEEKDIDQVMDLMRRYNKRYDMAPEYSREEAVHWFIPKITPESEQVIWTYVVEDENGKITDFFSFFSVESSVINNNKHSIVRVAYLFYYATEAGTIVPEDRKLLKNRLNELIGDALILAKKYNFDVLNALTLMDNALFLEDLKFGGGDGQLHYYLFNYRMNPIAGGVDQKNKLDEKNLSGIGMVML